MVKTNYSLSHDYTPFIVAVYSLLLLHKLLENSPFQDTSKNLIVAHGRRYETRVLL